MNPSSANSNAVSGDILVVDDHELVRLGFRALVQSHAQGLGQRPLAVQEARTLAEALSQYAEQQAGIAVVVLDLDLPDSDGLNALITFRQRFPQAVVVVNSGSHDPAIARNALALGAAAFFAKSGDLGDMLGFVYDCLLHGPQGANQHSPSNLPAFADVANLAGTDKLVPTFGPTLSTRQLQILQWLLEGKSNREISQCASLSEGTIKNHVSTLLLSFRVRSRAQLISKLRT